MTEPVSDRVQVAWRELCRSIHELDLIASIDGVLGWDQQVGMGAGAAPGRGDQRAYLGQLLRARATDPRMVTLLDTLDAADGLDQVQRRTVLHMRRELERSERVSADLTERIAKASTAGFAAWAEAKEARDYGRFAPYLERNIELTRERCDAIDPHRHPYDVLLDEYDFGTTTATLRPMFTRLREGLSALVRAITDRGEPPAPWSAQLDGDSQLRLHRLVIRAMGYDETRGGVGLAPHPFSVRVGATDVRIATRLREDDVLGSLAATMHEAGHALYEQGLPTGPGGSAAFGACSTGVHESQSRLWENQIGRSLPFYQWFAPILERHLADGATRLDPDALYRASNRVQPSVVRVSADEVTYNLHIIVRFEIEVALLEGKLGVREVPGVWHERMQEYVGVTPEHDGEGPLQDSHWSASAFGYFPSYTLGNLYAASLYGALRRAEPTFDRSVSEGDFDPTLSWLRARVHAHGRLLDAPDLMASVVGRRDHVADLLEYLRGRHGALHGIALEDRRNP